MKATDRGQWKTLMVGYILQWMDKAKVKQESNRQRTMEDIDGALHPAVDGQSLGESVALGDTETVKYLKCL